MSARWSFLEISDDLLRRNCRVRFRADGRSMLPTIRPGEVLWMEPVRPEHVRRGDLLLCVTPDRAVAHRVVRILRSGAERRFLLKGDGTEEADGVISAEQIIGRVVGVERGGRLRSLTGAPARWKWRLSTLLPAAVSTSLRAVARRARASCRALLPLRTQ